MVRHGFKGFKDYLTEEIVMVKSAQRKHARRRFLSVHRDISQKEAGARNYELVADAPGDGVAGVIFGLTEQSHNTLKCCEDCSPVLTSNISEYPNQHKQRARRGGL